MSASYYAEMTRRHPDQLVNITNFAGDANMPNALISFWPSLLCFIGAGVAFGLSAYFASRLDALEQDNLNPNAVREAINPLLRVELAAHVFGVLGLLLEMHPALTLLSLPTLAVRALWASRKSLVVDSTKLYDARTQSALRTRFNAMCVWHVAGLIFAVVNLLVNVAVAVMTRMHPGLK